MANTNYKDVKEIRNQFDTTDPKKAIDSVMSNPSDSMVFLKTLTQNSLLELINELKKKDTLTNGQSTLKIAEKIYQQKFNGKEETK